jgi:hypothetical protein
MLVFVLHPNRSQPEFVTLDATTTTTWNSTAEVHKNIYHLIHGTDAAGNEPLNTLTLSELCDPATGLPQFALYCKDLFDYRRDVMNKLATDVHCCVELKGAKLSVQKYGYMMGCCVIAPLPFREWPHPLLTPPRWDDILAAIASKNNLSDPLL